LMPRKKGEYERVQLLATPDILEWWNQMKDDPDRQERLREAVRKGMAIEKGELVTITPDQLKVYQAMETLYKSGILPTAEKAAPPVQSAVEKRKPNIGRLKSSIQSFRQ
jgi:hypothetical protein